MAAATKVKDSPLKTGYDPRGESKNSTGSFLSLKDGEFADVVILVNKEDIISYEQVAIWMTGKDVKSPIWVYTGSEDPMHDLGLEKEKRYRACLPLLVLDPVTKKPDLEPKVWSMGKQNHEAILEIADAAGELKGMEIRIKRTGEKLQTKYNLVPRGKRHDVDDVDEVDVISMLGPLTSDGVKEMLAERFSKASYEEFLDSYRGKKVKASSNSKGKVKAEEEEDEDISLDDLELR